MATQCSTVPNFYLQWNILHWKVLFCPNFVGGGSNCCHPYTLTANLCLSRRWRSETSDVGSVSNASSPDRCGTWQRCQAVGKSNRRTKAPWVPSKELQMYLSVQSCVGLRQHWRAAMLSIHCGISYLESYLRFYNNIRSLGWFQRQCYTDFL